MSGAAAQITLRRYEFGPFCLAAQIEIPLLAQVTSSRLTPVSIRLGPIAETLPDAVMLLPGIAFTTPNGQQTLLAIPGLARFLIAEGREVTVDLEPGALLPDVHSYLLGWVFGALCHQHGMLPLHASAVERDGLVTAFLGHSGAGKSTLAACLKRRGYRVIADDICLFAPQGETMRLIPVAGWIKLWRESLKYLEETPDERNRTFAAEDKFRMPLLRSRPAEDSLRLAHVVLLERTGEPEAPIRLSPLGSAATVAGMLGLIYLAYLPECTGRTAAVFSLCGDVLDGGARGFRLDAPFGWNRMEELLDVVEETLLPSGMTV